MTIFPVKSAVTENTVIPLATYPGRKGAAGSWQKIISEIPKCEIFIDAMCGSGYIGSLVKGCRVVLNDINETVIGKISCGGSVIKEKLHYECIIVKYDYPGSVFYFDPPYLMETRSYQQPIYKHEWNVADHKIFLHNVTAIKQPAMVSHYPCPLYDETLKDWRKTEYNTMTRAGLRVEALYMNYPPPVLLQCFGSVGENFTDRQRIKRKVERIMNKLKKEDPKERAAILSSIIDHFSYTRSTAK